MIVLEKGFIPLLPPFLFRRWLCGKAANGLERILCEGLLKKKKKNIDKCNGHLEIIIEAMLKMALSISRSNDQSANHDFCSFIYCSGENIPCQLTLLPGSGDIFYAFKNTKKSTKAYINSKYKILSDNWL